MAYTGSGAFGGIRFNDPTTAAAYQKGDGYYTTMPGIDPNKPGWGNLVPAGYELVGYKAPQMSGNFRSTNRAPIPGTSFAVLRKQMPAPAPAAAAPAPQSAPPPAAAAPQPAAPADTGPSKSDLMLQSLQDSIAAMQQGFMQSMQQSAQQFQQMQQAQNERMEALQQMMIQSQASQAERPTVAGVKSAVGQSGTPMQIARRGVSGSFGRRGMRMKNINV